MADSSQMYTLLHDDTPADAPVLLHNLTGFLDAGSAGRLGVEQILATLDHRVLARFDIDVMFDYRSRRPRMTFLSDHYDQIDLPELLLHEVHDTAGTRFLVLHGPEPDFAWQRFTDAVVSLVDRLGVSLTIGAHAVPWPAPHTRPVGITAHATDPSLIADRTSWVGALEVPGHIAGLLELRLGATGHPAMGYTAHVPHYLSAVDYPRAAVALLESVVSATGLSLPLDALREAATRADREIATQVSASAENSEAVQALEVQYDAFVGQQGLPLLGEGDGALPSGDEIAAQVELFLAQRNGDGREDG
ncbi:MAG: PAC2 family protein [Actinomycetota bacterium]|nr:PAC2 family protein [Actinomycetota bacterium]MDH5278754.1 PAC2 family protein [Actinomycetota bacterium]